MSASVRIPTILRTYTGGQAEVQADGVDPRRGHRGAGEESRGDLRAGSRRHRKAAAFRERVCRRRRRPVRRGAGHGGSRRRRASRSFRRSPAAEYAARSLHGRARASRRRTEGLTVTGSHQNRNVPRSPFAVDGAPVCPGPGGGRNGLRGR